MLNTQSSSLADSTTKRPIPDHPAHVQQVGKVMLGFPFLDQLPGLLDLLGGQLRLASDSGTRTRISSGSRRSSRREIIKALDRDGLSVRAAHGRTGITGDTNSYRILERGKRFIEYILDGV